MSEDIRDKELSRLYRESAGAEPPAALDRAILDAARRAAEPRFVQRRPWWQRWAVPVTAFATLVLTATLTLMVQHERERAEQAPESVPAKAAPAAPAPQPAAAPDSTKTDTAVSRQRPPGAPAPDRKMQDAGAPATQPFVPEAKKAAPAAAEALPHRETPQAPPVALPPAPASADSVESRARTAPLLRKQESPALGEQRAPEAWIEEIRQLRKQGRDKEAAEMLAELRKTYPDYVRPEDLR